uniref:DUF4283 domain-containing protein n=1 Tax=Cannabis sativa TaxID=3483 RepID=A0A803PI83_CANSA
MSSKIILSEKERATHVLTESDLQVAHTNPQFFLVARCLSNAFNPKTFMTRMGEFWSKKCRFEVTVSEMHSELYLLTLGCASDKFRLFEGEPWHYNNFLIILHSPTVLHNVSKEDLNTVQFWVQCHRLPFLSKSHALACKIGEWIGEYIDVYEDSLHESWGSFLRVRVRLDIQQPLMRGIEPELPYGLELLGDKLPKSGYERYRNDFSKANAYPFLTRLTRKTINSVYPKHISQKHFSLGSAPHPTLLTNAESSSQSMPEKHITNTTPELPSPFPSFFQPSLPINANGPTDEQPAINCPKTSTQIPAAMTSVHSTPVATYPHAPSTINLTPKHSPFS